MLANIEYAIALPVDIPSSIESYKKTLQYASTPLEFVFGIGLYLSPSDMELHPGNVQGYNNEIVIAGSDTVIGHNPGINGSEQIATLKVIRHTIVNPPTGRDVHIGPQAPMPHAEAITPITAVLVVEQAKTKAHKEEKVALITGETLGLVALLLSVC